MPSNAIDLIHQMAWLLWAMRVDEMKIPWLVNFSSTEMRSNNICVNTLSTNEGIVRCQLISNAFTIYKYLIKLTRSDGMAQ